MHIEKISASNKTKNENHVDPPQKINVSQISKSMKKTVLNHLKTLKKRAELTNDRAKKEKLPYRLNVQSVDNKVFLDVIIIDNEENELNRISRDITNNDFNNLIDNITSGTGLIIDDLPELSQQ